MEIHKRLSASKQAFEKLGSKRETREEQRQYLSEISMQFQDITILALNANYGGNDWFDQWPSLRFATAVTKRNELFADTMERYGHTYELKASKLAQKSKLPAADKSNDQISIRTIPKHIDLSEVTVEDETISKKICRNTMEWLSRVYGSSRGFELGTFDSSLIAITMKTQSSKWEKLALGYISDLASMAHTFIVDLLRLLCPDSRVRDGLMSVMTERLIEKYKDALDHVRFLLHVERMGRPTTLNRCFHENLEERYFILFHAPIISSLIIAQPPRPNE